MNKLNGEKVDIILLLNVLHRLVMAVLQYQ